MPTADQIAKANAVADQAMLRALQDVQYGWGEAGADRAVEDVLADVQDPIVAAEARRLIGAV